MVCSLMSWEWNGKFWEKDPHDVAGVGTRQQSVWASVEAETSVRTLL